MIANTSDARVALVTGASRGLGAAVAGSLAASGLHVVLTARDTARLLALTANIERARGHAIAYAADLTQAADVGELASLVARTWGRLDVLVANAGVLGPMRELAEVSERDWVETIETNLTANWRLLRAFDPLLRRSSAGRVVALTSSATVHLKPLRGPYAVSKAALEILVKTYALETKDTQIHTNLVDPGRFDSDMRTAAVPNEDRSMLPRPEEIAPMIVALSSPAWLGTGQSLRFAEWKNEHESVDSTSSMASPELHA